MFVLGWQTWKACLFSSEDKGISLAKAEPILQLNENACSALGGLSFDGGLISACKFCRTSEEWSGLEEIENVPHIE